ncbi:Glycosyl hydrolases family 32 protein [Prunus dulcis]|uniref:Glycosyl hydrolases family 32 protein n=1 Tax=Prunus dulcis TaxID=3755 RepID=A0A4Y1R3G2_PRUDU|nr:Glycosyl hydrolases family 32 protein [Prunus dulcis]
MMLLSTHHSRQTSTAVGRVPPRSSLGATGDGVGQDPQNPLMAPSQANQINASSFRDPTTAWLGPDKKWRVIIGGKTNQTGEAILYRSKDFLNWVKAKQPLHSAEKTGMWECPDFFPVSIHSQNGLDTSKIGPDVKHVFKVSLDNTRREYYTIGTYNIDKDIYIPIRAQWRNRRILWGWINESSTVEDDIKKGWSGLQIHNLASAIPRTLWLDKSGKQLVQWPVVEIEKLREKEVKLPSSVLKGGSVHEADVGITFGISDLKKAEVLDPSWTNPQLLCSRKGATVKGGLGPFGLLVLASKGLKEYTSVFYRIFKDHNKHVVLLCSDQSRSSLNKDNDKTTYGAFVNVDPLHEKLSLRSLIDHSIVESFGGEGKACITARVYPTLAINGDAHLYAFNYGTEDVKIRGSAWSLKTAKIN